MIQRLAALDQGIDARISAVNWATLFCPSIGGARIHMEQFTEGDLKACTLFWALTRTLDEDWPCRETAKTSQDCCDKVHSRRCSSASSRQSSQISAQAGPRHSFTRKLLSSRSKTAYACLKPRFVLDAFSYSPASPCTFLRSVSFVLTDAARHFRRRNELSNTAVSSLSRRSPPNNKTNNIQLCPGISITAYSF